MNNDLYVLHPSSAQQVCWCFRNLLELRERSPTLLIDETVTNVMVFVLRPETYGLLNT